MTKEIPTFPALIWAFFGGKGLFTVGAVLASSDLVTKITWKADAVSPHKAVLGCCSQFLFNEPHFTLFLQNGCFLNQLKKVVKVAHLNRGQVDSQNNCVCSRIHSTTTPDCFLSLGFLEEPLSSPSSSGVSCMALCSSVFRVCLLNLRCLTEPTRK